MGDNGEAASSEEHVSSGSSNYVMEKAALLGRGDIEFNLRLLELR